MEERQGKELQDASNSPQNDGKNQLDGRKTRKRAARRIEKSLESKNYMKQKKEKQTK